MNYAEMPAGPEMDQAVAELVMGWHARGFDGKWHDWYDQHEFVRGWSQWRPSTNIAHAWEVVERAIESNGCASVQSTGFEWDRRFIARIQFGTCFTTDRSALADTAPLAICRAALMALKPEGK